MSDFSFEDKIEELDQLLIKYRAKWQLNAISWLDYDDVCQIIRIHIFNKWHLWDQKRSFKPWASMVISNQIKNTIRNNYSNFAKPCLKCPHYMGGEGCSFTKSGVQDAQCDLFAKWKSKKEKAYNLKLPLPIDDSLFLGHTEEGDSFCYETSSGRLHKAIMSELSDKHKQIYFMLVVKGEDEKTVAKKFGFKGDKKNRETIRYKQISNLKKRFYGMAQRILKEQDIL